MPALFKGFIRDKVGMSQLSSIKILSFLTLTLLAMLAIFPQAVKAQEAGCINDTSLTITYNTVLPVINASTPAFTNCNGTYTYQWQISTDNIYFADISGATAQNLTYTTPLTKRTYFHRRTTCGKIVKYTNSVVVYAIDHACSDFGLSLSGTSGNNLASIKAGVITTTASQTIGEYVIEWYKDVVSGTPGFTSGSAGAADPAVTVAHPFAGEPAEGGTWHPVIKYIYINGIKYSRNYTPGVRYSPDLTHCLDSVIVTVNNLSCANGSDVNGSMYYTSQKYSHRMTYNNAVQSPTLASRSFRFDLDANNKYFAWYFAGAEVRDRVKITYKSPANGTSQQIEFYEIGSGAGAYHNQTTSPKIFQQVYFWKISNLSQFVFAPGDYLQIDIQPNATLSNTNWEFMCKCFTAVDCNIWDSSMRNIVQGSVGMTWNASICAYEVTYQKSTSWSSTNQSASILSQYHYMPWYGAAYAQGYWPGDTQVKLQLYKRTYGGYSSLSHGSYCASLPGDGAATFSKTGNVLTVTCTNAAVYDYYRNSYNTTIAASNMSNYTSDNTSLNHYKFLYFVWRKAQSCGDAYTNGYYYFHRSSPVIFDDSNRSFTVTLTNTTNGYPTSTADCNSIKADLDGWINNTSYSIGTPNIAPETSKVRADPNPFVGIYAFTGTQEMTDYTYHAFIPFPDLDVCNLSTKGWTSQRMPYEEYEFSLIRDRVKITDPAAPLTNWKLQRLMNSQGVYLGNNEANWITVYEIQNGNVIVNNGFPASP